MDSSKDVKLTDEWLVDVAVQLETDLRAWQQETFLPLFDQLNTDDFFLFIKIHTEGL